MVDLVPLVELWLKKMKVHEEEPNEKESEVNEQAETVITKESGVIFSDGKAILIEKKTID